MVLDACHPSIQCTTSFSAALCLLLLHPLHIVSVFSIFQAGSWLTLYILLNCHCLMEISISLMLVGHTGNRCMSLYQFYEENPFLAPNYNVCKAGTYFNAKILQQRWPDLNPESLSCGMAREDSMQPSACQRGDTSFPWDLKGVSLCGAADNSLWTTCIHTCS